jgi:enoyl-CoA hydratase/carnithine racemase
MLAEKDGSIGWMIFDHPERRNAVTQGMWLQIGGDAGGFRQG